MPIKCKREKGRDKIIKRSGFDRRQFCYTVHIPERRNGEFRRNADRYGNKQSKEK